MRYAKFKSFANNILKLSTYFFLGLFWAIPLHAYQASDFSWIPPFQSQDEKPSLTIIFDNSGSMNYPAYTSTFNGSKEYYGYFDPKKYYAYDSGSGKGYFYEVAPSNNPRRWNGNFLNWASMLRLDVAKKVMTGGEYANGITTMSQSRNSDDYSERSIDDRTKRTDLNGDSYYLTPVDKSSVSISRTKNARTLKVDGTTYNLKIKQNVQTGVIQKFADNARMALFFYHSDQGALVQNYMNDGQAHIENIISKINNLQAPNNWTPLSESLHTVLGYIGQSNTSGNNGPRYQGDSSYAVAPANNLTTDPYYFQKYKDKNTKGLVHCTRQNIILITDGEPTQDKNISKNPIRDHFSTNIGSYPNTYSFSSEGTAYLIDVAYYGHTTDLRTGDAFPGKQTIDLFTVYASFGAGSSQFLKDATMYGSFRDKNGDSKPQQSEYDRDGDGIPDNYFEAQTGQELEAAVNAAFSQATKTIASGTAAAVTPQTRDGEGAVYQAIFFPPVDTAKLAPDWAGQVHALFIDDNGNFREDSNGNKKLDKDDYIIKFEDGEIFQYNSTSNVSTKVNNVLDLKHIWSSSAWLNSLTDDQAVTQRLTYQTNSTNRYIITFADINNNMVVDSGEIQDFELSAKPDIDTLGNATYFYNYLTLYDSSTMSLDFSSNDHPIKKLRTNYPNRYKNLLAERAKLQVEFIRGKDVSGAAIEGIADPVRSRKHGTTTWRLGDIIYSSPTLVAAPAENYDLIYDDRSYENFFKTYKDRRQVIYVGANDGMLHAFNGGFYNSTSKGFDTSSSNKTEFSLGMELWAYVPYNLLPHLRWLMNSQYGAELHVNYMDLEPRVFDVRIFPNSDTHPNGWGTILVAGMRLGGATIKADVDKDGAFTNGTDRTMSSAYVIVDITDPEQPPNILAELAIPGLGFTTCNPAVIPMTSPNATLNSDNEWFLVFGSGPANAAGEADPIKLPLCTSDQNGRLFILDLKHLVQHKEIRTINEAGNIVDGPTYFATTEAGSFVSDPVAVDLDIGKENDGEMKADVIYYGTVAGDTSTSTGKVYRIVTSNKMPVSNNVDWGKNTLIDIAQPVSASVNVATDENDKLWVYFGTGRFYNQRDADQKSKRSFFGIKEPVSNATNELPKKTWDTVLPGNLYSSSDITISNATCLDKYTKNCVKIAKKNGTTLSWDALVAEVQAKDGWKQDFTPAWERVTDQAGVLGDAVIFTSYTPSEQICDFGGSSNLWGLYYITGTSYFDPILGSSSSHLLFVPLGDGKASRPSFIIKKDGTVDVPVQTGGKLVKPTIKPPNYQSLRSRASFWRENLGD
ncbi:hypothetical protein MASR1M90_00730 [Desulfovibrionales bacterium]